MLLSEWEVLQLLYLGHRFLVSLSFSSHSSNLACPSIDFASHVYVLSRLLILGVNKNVNNLGMLLHLTQ